MSLFTNHIHIDHEWVYKIKEAKNSLERFQVSLGEEFNSIYPNVTEWNKRNFLNILYIRLLYAVADKMVVELVYFLENKTYYEHEESLTRVFDRIYNFPDAKYKGVSESELVSLIDSLDKIASGFDGKPFVNWSVRDIVCSIRGKEYPNYDQDILDHIMNDKFIE